MPNSETLCARHGVATASTRVKIATVRANEFFRVLIVASICHVKSDLTSTMASTGNAVARARMAHNLTQTELARRAGISRQALSAIESGASLAAASSRSSAKSTTRPQRWSRPQSWRVRPMSELQFDSVPTLSACTSSPYLSRRTLRPRHHGDGGRVGADQGDARCTELAALCARSQPAMRVRHHFRWDKSSTPELRPARLICRAVNFF